MTSGAQLSRRRGTRHDTHILRTVSFHDPIPLFGAPQSHRYARLTSILMSHFMMNLQEAKRVTSGSMGESRSVSLVRFERVVGSIGQPLGLSVVEQVNDSDDASDSG